MNKSNPEATNADREIVTTRIFAAPRRLVFKAWTDPKMVAEWWGLRGWNGQHVSPVARATGYITPPLPGLF